MIGQESVIRLLKAIISQNKYEASYLFSGPYGVGKTTLGRIFSKAVLCDAPENGGPCCHCESCLLFNKNQHFGYHEMDAATVGGKEDMIKLRDESSYLTPYKKKIILIDECHDISKLGQEALLNQIEQCPEHLIYIFCTTDPFKMKDTLRSRCMEFPITKVELPAIVNRLKHICNEEKFSYTDEALLIIAEKFEGHLRDALNLLEESSYLGPINLDVVRSISKDYEEEIFTILFNLGRDLSKTLEAYRKIFSSISAIELYGFLLAMVNDSCKFLYGYENFSLRRKQFILKLKEAHGYSLLEFLNYLISRDKYVDKIGLQSDLIVMHCKFEARSFLPKEQNKAPVSIDPQNQTPSQDSISSVPILNYAQLSKMSVKDRSKFLRETRKNQKLEQDESEKVPLQWPLPKEDRLGEDSSIDILTPQEFSQTLVGGRGGEQF